MSTTITPDHTSNDDHTAVATARSASGARRRRRFGFGLLTMLVGIAGPALALAEPAQAAGSVSTQITFCSPVANHPVQLQIWNGTKWVGYKNGNSGADRCGTFRYVDANYYYRVAGSYSYNSGYCGSSYSVVYATGWKASVNNRNVNVGGMSYESGFYWC